MQINIRKACELLGEQDNIAILAHHKPDGDTLGSSFGLMYGLEQLGKTVRVECSDGYPEHYRFLYGDYRPKQFEAAYVVSVDIADAQLLGDLRETYEGRIDVCIDHHKSNDLAAAYSLVDPSSAATAQIIYQILVEMGISVTPQIATSLFTGISTDTGCFRYDNVTSDTHRMAAELIDLGAEHGMINKVMFDTKSKGRLEIDKILMNSLEYYFGGRCAVVTLSAEMPMRFGVTEEELDGISSFPRKIEGVMAGVTLREKEDGAYRVSIRSGEGVDASRICARLGGGGHKNAAGCTLEGTRDQVRDRVLEEIGKELERLSA